MYVGRDFTNADPQENAVYSFDFTQQIGNPADPITSVSWQINSTGVDVVDTNPSSHLSLPGINGQVVSVLVSGLMPGAQYQLLAAAKFGSGQTLALWSNVTCDQLPVDFAVTVSAGSGA
jgi:hypothetical protein